jgi:catechol 2,3-dioxygenase-like lactoylglutathione lyase family enzyme
MWKINSISGLVFKVKDLDKTKQFYTDLGFRVEEKGNYDIAYVNWFWIEFHKGNSDNGKTGSFLHISIKGLDEYYGELVKKGLKPLGEPRDLPFGRREFELIDPDGYKLTFFEKI